jgi:AraC-like DNA-binding protein
VRPTVEHIERSREASFVVFRTRTRAFPFLWHHHAEYELTLIERGRGQRFVGDDIASFDDGDLVLLGPWLPHTWRSDDNRWQSAIVVQFGAGWIDSLCQTMPELHTVRNALPKAAAGVQLMGSEARQAGEILRRRVLKGASLERVAGLLEALHCVACARQVRNLATMGYAQAMPAFDERLTEVCRYVDQHLDAPIAQTDVAEIAGLTPEAFSRFFRRLTGRTFVEYVHEIRIARACRLLQETEQSISQICFASGFGNLSNFNRVFLRLKGLSPLKYRKGFRPHEGPQFSWQRPNASGGRGKGSLGRE